MAVTPSLKELKNILKRMTWKERVDYLWTYYKLVLAALLAAVMVISIVVSAIHNKQIVTLYSGVLLSANMQQDDREAVVKDLTELFDGDGEKRVVDLSELTYIPGDDPTNMEMNSAAIMKITMMVAAESLDYIITDSEVYKEVIQHSDYADLRNILSQDQQAQLEQYMIWKEANEEQPSYPMALDISHTEFVKKYMPYQEELYLVFAGNTENSIRNQDFIDYILNWTES